MPHILIVEDDAAIRGLVEEALTDEGYAVTAAQNGRTALAWLAAQTPDLIVIDLYMPDMDGHTLCQHIQAAPRTAAIPIVLCSATQDAAIPAACRYAAVVPKPFNLDRLFATLRQLLPALA